MNHTETMNKVEYSLMYYSEPLFTVPFDWHLGDSG